MKKLWEISTSVHRLEVDKLFRTRSSFTFQEPIQQVETISPCATTYPRPGPADSHALIPQVPWIPGSCQHQQTQSHQCSREFLSLAACLKYKVIPGSQGQGQELGLQGQGQGVNAPRTRTRIWTSRTKPTPRTYLLVLLYRTY